MDCICYRMKQQDTGKILTIQIVVNVFEAKYLRWEDIQTASSYVLVGLGKNKQQTSIRRHMREPSYKESFVFELHATTQEVQRQTLWVAVMETRCCIPPKLLGEINIDLSAIWLKPGHHICRKWTQLFLPSESGSKPAGFLQVGVAMICHEEEQEAVPLVTGIEKNVTNLLLPNGSEQQRANYRIIVYCAFNLPTSAHCHCDKKGKLPSTHVRVTFCGIMVKTRTLTRNKNPMFNEELSIVEMFPNLSQIVHLEVCTNENGVSKVLSVATLNLGHISHDGEKGFVPTFGPSLIHLSGACCLVKCCNNEYSGPFYGGSLLIALRTVVPYYQQEVRSTNVVSVEGVQQRFLWEPKDFALYCPLFEVSMLDRKMSGKLCGVAITIGEITLEKNSDDQEFVTLLSEIKKLKLNYTGPRNVIKTKPVYGYLDFGNANPVLQIALRFPDLRTRIYRNNFIYSIIRRLESTIAEVENALKVDRRLNNRYTPDILMNKLNHSVDDAAGSVVKFIDIVNATCKPDDCEMQKHYTELDHNQYSIQDDEMAKIREMIHKKTKSCEYASSPLIFNKKSVKNKLNDVKELIQHFKNVAFKTPDGWPNVIIWLLADGSRVAYAQLSVADIIHSVIPEESGRDCGRIQTLYLKHTKCSKHGGATNGCACIAAKVEIMLWMGLYRQKYSFKHVLPENYELTTNDSAMLLKSKSLMVECRVYVHKGRLYPETGGTSYSTFLRVNVLNTVKETEIRDGLTPTWNQVLKIPRVMFTTEDRLKSSPPVLLIELYNNNHESKYDMLGRFEITPVVDDMLDSEYVPKLQCYTIFKDGVCKGEVLISAHIVQIPEKVIKTTLYSMDEYNRGPEKVDSPTDNNIEHLPSHLIPSMTTYKIDVYWWGLRDIYNAKRPCVFLEIDDFIIKSSVIKDCGSKRNANFPGEKTSQICLLLDQVYSPSLNVRLYDSGTFGRTILLGSNNAKDPLKFSVDWFPKTQRDASLNNMATISSGKFSRVNSKLFVLKSSDDIDKKVNKENNRKNYQKPQRNASLLRKLFNYDTPEEQCSLLPMYEKKEDRIQACKKPSIVTADPDWWLRYLCFQNICIYNTELELQPNFNKFKDWCSSLKLYSGTKTGVYEKDRLLYCGLLKAGIAIYKWPPPQSTIPVNASGADLNKSYFAEYPVNHPSKYLVRAYIVKGFDMKTKESHGSCQPYVMINCGKKILGHRNSHVPKSVNPVFARMFEFQCTLPEDYKMTISVYDYDLMTPDDLIGSTSIDLEDRVYTKHRARVGLSPVYKLSGPNKWRDCVKPSTILDELCLQNHLDRPVYPDAHRVVVNGIEFRDEENDETIGSALERMENICLYILQVWHTLPLCGCYLVPEHVETRILYNPDKPGIAMGKLHLWVDIFPLDALADIPPAVDITPRSNKEFELRVVVWKVSGLKKRRHQENKYRARHFDVYVKAWIGSPDVVQLTDIHYNVRNCEALFNWRMLFSFLYRIPETRLDCKNEANICETEEESQKQTLFVQVTDRDALLPDDVLGSLSLNLSDMPVGASTIELAHSTPLQLMPRINLFCEHTIRSWWPLFITTSDQKEEINGYIELGITLLTKEQAMKMPAGSGRDPPCPLEEPRRQKYSIHPVVKRVLKCFGTIILFVLSGICLFYAMHIFDISGALLDKFA